MTATIPLVQNPEHQDQSVQPSYPPIPRELLAGLRWDDLKLFLHVVDTSSMRGAAKTAKVAVNTVRARIARLEDQLGAALLRRDKSGVTPTPAGIRLRHVALSMRGTAIADGIYKSAYLRRPDELRIGTSEGLGSGWLTPRLLDLQAELPHLTMSMICDNDLEIDRSDDLDIGIVWHPPRNPELIVARLATLHFMPFASRAYLRDHGVPQNNEDLLNHRFIEQAAPGVKSNLLDQLVGTDRPLGFLPIRTNSSLAVLWAVANGAGIAFMPTYVSALVKKFVPIDLPFRIKFDIFYYYHPEGRTSAPIMAGVQWLKRCFDPVAHPWFRSDFVHPDKFFERNQDNVVQLFEPLVGDDLF